MAHPDDCEILVGGTLALLAEKGWQVHIISMTPGDCGSAKLEPEQIAAVRRGEAAKAAVVIGATFHCLECRDVFIVFDERTVRRAISLVRSIAPTLMFTHSLDDYVMDHEITARIARTVSFAYSVPHVSPGDVVAGSCIPHLYYADPLEGVDCYGNPIEPGVWVDVASSMPAKTKALKCHASQRDWLLAYHGMDQYVRSMQAWAGKRGKDVGVKYAEAFRQHKGHPYPHDCLLKRELGSLVRRAD